MMTDRAGPRHKRTKRLLGAPWWPGGPAIFEGAPRFLRGPRDFWRLATIATITPHQKSRIVFSGDSAVVGGGAPKGLNQILFRAPKRLGPALMTDDVSVLSSPQIFPNAEMMHLCSHYWSYTQAISWGTGGGGTTFTQGIFRWVKVRYSARWNRRNASLLVLGYYCNGAVHVCFIHFKSDHLDACRKYPNGELWP